jgi:hypothetical protein
VCITLVILQFHSKIHGPYNIKLFYGIVEGMAVIIRVPIMMVSIVIQRHSSVGIHKYLYFILHGTGLFMGKPDKSHYGI